MTNELHTFLRAFIHPQELTLPRHFSPPFNPAGEEQTSKLVFASETPKESRYSEQEGSAALSSDV